MFGFARKMFTRKTSQKKRSSASEEGHNRTEILQTDEDKSQPPTPPRGRTLRRTRPSKNLATARSTKDAANQTPPPQQREADTFETLVKNLRERVALTRQNNATLQEQDDRSYEDDLLDQDDNPETQRPPSRSSSQPLSSIVETTDSSSHTLAPSLNTGIRQRQQQPINNARKQASPSERSGSQVNPITVTAQIEPITICLRKCSSAEFIDVQCQMGLLRTEVQLKDKILRTVRAENEELATELKNQKWILESAESQVEQIMRKNTEAFSMNRKLNQLVTAQLEEIERLNYQKQVVENDSLTLREIIYNLQAELRQYDIVPSGYKYPERVQTLISRLTRPLKPVPGYEFEPLIARPKCNPERDSPRRRAPGPSSLSQEIKLQDDEDESGPKINYERPATPTPPDSNDD